MAAHGVECHARAWVVHVHWRRARAVTRAVAAAQSGIDGGNEPKGAGTVRVSRKVTGAPGVVVAAAAAVATADAASAATHKMMRRTIFASAVGSSPLGPS